MGDWIQMRLCNNQEAVSGTIQNGPVLSGEKHLNFETTEDILTDLALC